MFVIFLLLGSLVFDLSATLTQVSDDFLLVSRRDKALSASACVGMPHSPGDVWIRTERRGCPVLLYRPESELTGGVIQPTCYRYELDGQLSQWPQNWHRSLATVEVFARDKSEKSFWGFVPDNLGYNIVNVVRASLSGAGLDLSNTKQWFAWNLEADCKDIAVLSGDERVKGSVEGGVYGLDSAWLRVLDGHSVLRYRSKENAVFQYAPAASKPDFVWSFCCEGVLRQCWSSFVDEFILFEETQ